MQNVALDKLLITFTYLLNAPNNFTQDRCQLPQLKELNEIMEIGLQRSAKQSHQLGAINREMQSISDQLRGPDVCLALSEGVATISLNIGKSEARSTQVLCRSNKYGTGWMLVAHHRANSHTFLTAAPEQWIKGFGDVNGEFFIGVENLVAITTRQMQQLLIVTTGYGVEHFDRFAAFALDAKHKVVLLGAHSGDRVVGTSKNSFKAIRESLETVKKYLNPKLHTDLRLDIYLRPTTLDQVHGVNT